MIILLWELAFTGMSYTDIGRHIYKPLNVLINMRRKYERYSEEFKLSVVRDYYSCGMMSFPDFTRHFFDS